MSHDSEDDSLTRRQALALGLAGAAGLAGLACSTSTASPAEAKEPLMSVNSGRMPVAFLPHGGGPWPFVELGFGDQAGMDALAAYLRSVRSLPRQAPRALLVISAHWEEAVPTVMTSSRPPMLYDYYGFPPESYTLTWPAPGEPKLAARVQELLAKAGFATATDTERGYDHGTFVPLKLTYPEAEVPTVQLSLKQGLDPAEHLAMGRALAPLRDEGVFIIGSGMTFHNLRAFRDPRAVPIAEQFDGWLREAATLEPAARDEALTRWASAPAARLAHPREEHLLPLMVIAGAAGQDRGTVAFKGTFGGLRLSAYHYG
ncbi:MAG TPA: class III extradiol ring-cleavage dioxygenase [Myxococcaceae bacterium]|jgi:aromatic ring-opening dioxygenase catalytic subunit (LigB family)